MVGERGLPSDAEQPQAGSALQNPSCFTVRGMNARSRDGIPLLKDISFEIPRGTIVGLAGVSGNGQRELAEALAGLLPIESGEIMLDGHEVSRLSVAARIGLGSHPDPAGPHRRGDSSRALPGREPRPRPPLIRLQTDGHFRASDGQRDGPRDHPGIQHSGPGRGGPLGSSLGGEYSEGHRSPRRPPRPANGLRIPDRQQSHARTGRQGGGLRSRTSPGTPKPERAAFC